jgi:hypothetical protein
MAQVAARGLPTRSNGLQAHLEVAFLGREQDR